MVAITLCALIQVLEDISPFAARVLLLLHRFVLKTEKPQTVGH